MHLKKIITQFHTKYEMLIVIVSHIVPDFALYKWILMMAVKRYS